MVGDRADRLAAGTVAFRWNQELTMSEALHSIVSMPTPFNMVVLITLIVMTASLVGTVAKQIRKYVCHRQELEFKRELLDRGLAAEEVERIVVARSPNVESRA